MTVLSFDPRALEQLVVRVTGHFPETITPMPGGASTRRYFRIKTRASTLVAMFVPDATPEEVTSGNVASSQWPFVEIHPLLARHGVRVPAILGEATRDGLLLLEDLGDETLAAFLERAPGRKAEVYRIAVNDLARAQH